MVFIEEHKRNNMKYYYVSKNFRVGVNKWKRIRQYVGKKKPTKEKVRGIAELIEKQAVEKGWKKPETKHKHLSDEQAEVLEDLKTVYQKWWKSLPKESKNKFDADFLVRFTYNSNAIEGSTLSLRDTNLILQEGILPSDKTELEYNEVINGREAMKFIKLYRGELNETFLLKIHSILTKSVLKSAGEYRDHNVIIQGSELRPPQFSKVNELMKKFFSWYNNNKSRLHPLELTCIVHTKFVRIHPFSDGNGRTSRLLMNFVLHKLRYPMFFIENSKRRQYYNALEKSDKGNEKAFVDLIFKNIIEQHKH